MLQRLRKHRRDSAVILLLDNYDSFSYNLYQLIGVIDPDIRIVRNDALGVEDIRRMTPSCLILSPGPGYPKDAGICISAVRQLHAHVPILGVCLGHQALCEAFGASIGRAETLMHGKSSEILLDNASPLFHQLPPVIRAGRYHSLAARRETLPDCLRVIAETADGEIMAVCHKEFPVYGLQFHPESILTPDGSTILRNFLKIRKETLP